MGLGSGSPTECTTWSLHLSSFIEITHMSVWSFLLNASDVTNLRSHVVVSQLFDVPPYFCSWVSDILMSICVFHFDFLCLVSVALP